jgi:Zn-finger nucleic acid-binding protein
MTIADVTVDVCKGGCAGIWFDNQEIKKFDEPHESAGQPLLDVEKDPNLTIDHTKRMICPRCEDIVMMRHFFSIKKKVLLDECPGCGGFWLDAGELRQIRSLFKTEEHRHNAASDYFQELFATDFKALKDDARAQAAKIDKAVNLFRYICPSYYIPGKQKWGAF